MAVAVWVVVVGVVVAVAPDPEGRAATRAAAGATAAKAVMGGRVYVVETVEAVMVELAGEAGDLPAAEGALATARGASWAGVMRVVWMVAWTVAVAAVLLSEGRVLAEGSVVAVSTRSTRHLGRRSTRWPRSRRQATTRSTTSSGTHGWRSRPRW